MRVGKSEPKQPYKRAGDYIRNARCEAGLSLRDTAELLELRHVELGRIERGLDPLPRDRWVPMLQLLEGHIDERYFRIAMGEKKLLFRKAPSLLGGEL